MSLLALAGTNSATGGYEIDNSLKFESDNAEYLMAEGRSQGNQQTWTFSIWLKRTEVNNGFVAQYIMSAGSDGKLSLYFRDDASYPGDQIFIYMDEGNTQKWLGRVNESFRDPSAWYHLVFTCDTTDSTPADRTKLYINGEQRTITYNDTMNVNTSTRVGDNGGKFALGARIATPGYNFNGYMAEAVLVDGSALTPTSFGEYDSDSGIWKPKDVSSLSLGTTGFHMNFDDSSNVGKVQRGNNGGNFDKYNLTAADQATDTPTNNFCVMNAVRGADRVPLMSEGATVIGNNANGYKFSEGTMGVANGKWYWEMKPTVNANTLVSGAGIASDTLIGFYQVTGNFTYHYDGNRYVNGAATGYGAAWATNDIIGFAYDADNWTLTCYINNSSQGNLLASQADISAETFLPYTYSYGTHTYQWNFGGYTSISNAHTNTDENGYGSFVYAPPSGYYALCTKNLEEFG